MEGLTCGNVGARAYGTYPFYRKKSRSANLFGLGQKRAHRVATAPIFALDPSIFLNPFLFLYQAEQPLTISVGVIYVKSCSDFFMILKFAKEAIDIITQKNENVKR